MGQFCPITSNQAIQFQFKIGFHTLLGLPCSCQVNPDLLQQTFPVTDVQVGPASPYLGLDVEVQRLQLAVRLSFEHRLYVCAHSCVDALTTIALF